MQTPATALAEGGLPGSIGLLVLGLPGRRLIEKLNHFPVFAAMDPFSPTMRYRTRLQAKNGVTTAREKQGVRTGEFGGVRHPDSRHVS